MSIVKRWPFPVVLDEEKAKIKVLLDAGKKDEAQQEVLAILRQMDDDKREAEVPEEAAQRTINDMPNMDDAHLADVRRNAHKQMMGWRRLLKQRGDPETWRSLVSWCDVEAAAVAEQCIRIMKPKAEATCQ